MFECILHQFDFISFAFKCRSNSRGVEEKGEKRRSCHSCCSLQFAGKMGKNCWLMRNLCTAHKFSLSTMRVFSSSSFDPIQLTNCDVTKFVGLCCVLCFGIEFISKLCRGLAELICPFSSLRSVDVECCAV